MTFFFREPGGAHGIRSWRTGSPAVKYGGCEGVIQSTARMRAVAPTTSACWSPGDEIRRGDCQNATLTELEMVDASPDLFSGATSMPASR